MNDGDDEDEEDGHGRDDDDDHSHWANIIVAPVRRTRERPSRLYLYSLVRGQS